ncbi:hypothetical protein N7471_011239 [Penicillium samsonianum]|uniref:uncharacterized protein n=1 Tax=Penicillium samsonianum TaxID=1882272 RepID=UPI0025479B91|nr:uncharacterized protein N7471_011239 [Penicillium samsonianum]KAJ6123922.1 hypothetical protein N7471_011239 [Penicillium samsonianum]
MDLEIGHINFSVSSKSARPAVSRTKMKVLPWTGTLIVIPLLCGYVSDRTDMGGETALGNGNGEVVKVRGRQIVRILTVILPVLQVYKGAKGLAVGLQGRYIEHKALQALCMTERITMVTSFRPRSSSIKDDSVLTAVCPVSILGDLYHQFGGVFWHMDKEIVEDDKVQKGMFDDSHLHSEELKQQWHKKQSHAATK